MLTVYGMDDRIGPISLKVDDPYELQVFGEKVVDDIGNQIQLLVGHAYQEAQRILRDNMDILDEVARVLMEKEKISSEEFEEFFRR
jgi:cell division protease FtsH